MFIILLSFFSLISENSSLVDDIINWKIVLGSKDITFSLVMLGIGIILLALRQNKRVSNLLQPGLSEYSAKRVSKPATSYDKLDIEKLEKVVTKLNTNYRILITVYGVLLAFVVSNTMEFAFSNWAVIIWTGWILAIIVRTGTISLRLSDITELEAINTEEERQKIARLIYASKTYAKHALIVLILAIAFLPAIYVNPNNDFDQENLPWEPQITIFSIGLGIIGVTTFVYFFVMRFSEFQTYEGPQGLWLVTIILILIGIVPNIYHSPLEPIPVRIQDGTTFMIPQIIDVILLICYFFGIIMCIIYFVGFTYDTKRLKKFFRRIKISRKN